jgi:uncharacterized oligopeptide transporter (OPT) family protein
MIAGAAFGALLGFFAYTLFTRHAVPGGPSLPAPSMQAWRAVAASVAGSALPPGAPAAALATFGVGLVLCALRTRWARLPAPVALGIGALLPLSATATLLIGGVAAGLAQRSRPEWSATHLTKLASGAIMGESLIAVIAGIIG